MVDLAGLAIPLGKVKERLRNEFSNNYEGPGVRNQALQHGLQSLLDTNHTAFKKTAVTDPHNQEHRTTSNSNSQADSDNPKLDASWATVPSDTETDIEIVPATPEGNSAGDDASTHVANDASINANITKQQYTNLTQHLKAAIIKADTYGKNSTDSKKSLENLEKATKRPGFRFFGNDSDEGDISGQTDHEGAVTKGC